MKNTLFLGLALAVGCLVAVIGVAPVQAGYNPYPVNHLYNQDGFQTFNFLPQERTIFGGDYVEVTALDPEIILSGLYDFTYLGYEAEYINLLIDEQDRTQFNNMNTPIGTSFTYAIENLFFQTLGLGGDMAGDRININHWSNQVHIYKLNVEWTLTDTHVWVDAYEGLVLPGGSFIIGFEDLPGTGGGDFADMIIAATPNPVPIPAAVWLLGSGLLGLVGVRRFRKG